MSIMKTKSYVTRRQLALITGITIVTISALMLGVYLTWSEYTIYSFFASAIIHGFGYGLICFVCLISLFEYINRRTNKGRRRLALHILTLAKNYIEKQNFCSYNGYVNGEITGLLRAFGISIDDLSGDNTIEMWYCTKDTKSPRCYDLDQLINESGIGKWLK